MWTRPIGETLRNWFAKFGSPGEGSSEEAILEDFSDLDERIREYDNRRLAQIAEQIQIEARLKRLEIQSRRD